MWFVVYQALLSNSRLVYVSLHRLIVRAYYGMEWDMEWKE